jgi:hypothetical protein
MPTHGFERGLTVEPSFWGLMSFIYRWRPAGQHFDASIMAGGYFGGVLEGDGIANAGV